MKNMGKNMQPKTGIYKMREWRGIKDSAYDYAMWCKLWYKLIKWAMGHPVQNVKAIFRYRWMFTYLTVPSFFDRNCEGFRGAALRGGRNNFLLLPMLSPNILTPSFPQICIFTPAARRLRSSTRRLSAWTSWFPLCSPRASLKQKPSFIR